MRIGRKNATYSKKLNAVSALRNNAIMIAIIELHCNPLCNLWGLSKTGLGLNIARYCKSNSICSSPGSGTGYLCSTSVRCSTLNLAGLTTVNSDQCTVMTDWFELRPLAKCLHYWILKPVLNAVCFAVYPLQNGHIHLIMCMLANLIAHFQNLNPVIWGFRTPASGILCGSFALSTISDHSLVSLLPPVCRFQRTDTTK